MTYNQLRDIIIERTTAITKCKYQNDINQKKLLEAQARIAELENALRKYARDFVLVSGGDALAAHDATVRKAALLEAQQAEISSFCMNYRMKCDEETKSLHIQIEAQQARIVELEAKLGAKPC